MSNAAINEVAEVQKGHLDPYQLHVRRKAGGHGQVGRPSSGVDPADPFAWDRLPDPPSPATAGAVLLWIGAIVITGFVLLSEMRRWGIPG